MEGLVDSIKGFKLLKVKNNEFSTKHQRFND